MIPDRDIREAFLHQTRKVDFLNSCSIFGMYALMIGYTQCDDYVDQLCAYTQNNMKTVEQFIRSELPGMHFKGPEATYLAWIDARDVPYSSEQIQEALINIGGVGIMKGETYGDNGEKYLRMNLGCPLSKVQEGLKRMKKAMDYLYEENKEKN